MKSGAAQGGSFIHRWLSRTSNATSSNANYESDVEPRSRSTSSRSNAFSPPPLTDSSSTTDSASTILTPKTVTSHIHSPSTRKSSSRYSAAKTPCTPPTRYAALPSVSTIRKPAIS
ncbi:hypothetical protein K439DRAFT_642734 [Ramaria rubella]|nr:hypothetical protein K439DRAFT_642734 [Ramaria rubella]